MHVYMYRVTWVTIVAPGRVLLLQQTVSCIHAGVLNGSLIYYDPMGSNAPSISSMWLWSANAPGSYPESGIYYRARDRHGAAGSCQVH